MEISIPIVVDRWISRGAGRLRCGSVGQAVEGLSGLSGDTGLSVHCRDKAQAGPKAKETRAGRQKAH